MKMYAYEKFKSEVVSELEKATGKKISPEELEVPPDPKLGDLSTSIAFKLSKEQKKNSKEIAEELAKKMSASGLIKEIKTVGPYINFYVNMDKYAGEVLKESIGSEYGKSDAGKGKTVLLEYSQLNPNKPMHVGHLRNNLLGMAVANSMQANGFKVIKASYINDRGIHICKAMLSYQKWGEAKGPDVKSDHFVGKFYTNFIQKAKDHPNLEQEALDMLNKWEEEDPQTRELWKKIVNWAYDGWNKTYDLLGTKFDVYFYESDSYKEGKKIALDALEKGIFKKDDEGAVVAELEKYNIPNKVIMRPDGTSLYITNDMALAKIKFEKHNPDLSIYCVGSAQETYFKQLFKIIELLGIAEVNKCYHLSHGMVYLPTGKMSSREGTVVYADDLIKEIIELAKQETKKKKMSEDVEKTAKQVGLGALKFGMLKTDAKKNISFEKEKVVSFEGDTGPYLQYAHARCSRILEKLGEVETPDYSQLKTSQEKELVKKISEFPDVVKKAGLNYEIHSILQSLLELVHTFSDFYEKCPVIKAETEGLKSARGELVKATKNVLKIGLNLLGIEAPEKM